MDFSFCTDYISQNCVYHFCISRYFKKSVVLAIQKIISMIFSQKKNFNFYPWNLDSGSRVSRVRGSYIDVVRAYVLRKLYTRMHQPCPFVSGENASTVQDDDGEIVLLVHCEIWIAGIRANEVVAGRPCSISVSLSPSCHTRSHPAFHPRRLRP